MTGQGLGKRIFFDSIWHQHIGAVFAVWDGDLCGADGGGALRVIAPLSFSAQGISRVMKKDHEANALTTREIQVLEKLSDGLSASSIGLELFITQATVKTHLASIYRKLDSKNRIQAIIAAKKIGLLLH